MPKSSHSTANGRIRRQLQEAIHACQEKKGEDISVLKLGPQSAAFTDYFVLCTGTNPRQIQAISDEIETRLERAGMKPAHTEGYNQADWVLLDYVDFVVHVFSPKARSFYDLERLWKSATRLDPANLKALAAPAKLVAVGGTRARRNARPAAASSRRSKRRKG
ncbi:MAG: ribosome silencing factor [Acidobacteriales bacterium]|nr:ribosome silencing factor [Terriglobales bacterium]